MIKQNRIILFSIWSIFFIFLLSCNEFIRDTTEKSQEKDSETNFDTTGMAQGYAPGGPKRIFFVETKLTESIILKISDGLFSMGKYVIPSEYLYLDDRMNNSNEVIYSFSEDPKELYRVQIIAGVSLKYVFNPNLSDGWLSSEYSFSVEDLNRMKTRINKLLTEIEKKAKKLNYPDSVIYVNR